MMFAGHAFTCHPSGLLYWPAQKLAVVADLHLEKGSHFAKRGFFVPPYDSRETLGKLNDALNALDAEKLMVLGDTFHDATGFARLTPDDSAAFLKLAAYSPIWVRGNHDGAYVPPGFEGCDERVIENIVFRHEAAAHAQGFEISGHFHPKAEVEHKGGRISRPCFVEDGQRMILPAFGAYTGGLLVSEPAIASLFPNGHSVHMLGAARVFTLPPPLKSASH